VDTTVNAVELRSRLAHGDDIRLIDVRTTAEFETGHIPASYHVPLDALREHRDEFRHVDTHVVLVCQSGNRAAQAAERLADAGLANVQILDGGITRWVAIGGDVNRGRQRWPIERQVRLAAGAIVLTSVLASLALPAAGAIAGLVGGGLVIAALSDTCAMGNLLARLPYNRGARCDVGAIVEELTNPPAPPEPA
jgi:rhodanese-related sulfurtransferase